MNERRKAFLLDTSVLMHDPNSIFKFGDNNIIIPIIVLEELNGIKEGRDMAKAATAREVHRILDELSEGKLIPKPLPPKKKQNGGGHTESDEPEVSALFFGGTSLGKELGEIEFRSFEKKIHERVREKYVEDIPDHKILSAAFVMQKTEKERIKARVILVTKDRNLRLKARSLGIEVQDFENDKVNVKRLYMGRGAIVDPNMEELIARLCETKKGPVTKEEFSKYFTEEQITPNKFFALKMKPDQKSTLARIDEKMEFLHPVARNITVSGITPRNSEQAFCVDAILQEHINLVTLLGKAGTGKTLMAIATAIHLLKEGKFDHLVIAAAMVALGAKEIGALPGDEKEKVRPYMQGLFDAINLIKSKIKEQKINPSKIPKTAKKKEKYISMAGIDYISQMEKDGKIEIQPLALIRGRTFNNTIVIVDEAQNLTPHDTKAIITRAGENCLMIMCGDIEQIDSPRLDARSSGLSHVVDKFSGQEIVAHVTLEKGERSKLAELGADLL